MADHDDFQVGSSGNWWESSRNPSVTAVAGEPIEWTSSSSDPRSSDVNAPPSISGSNTNSNNSNSNLLFHQTHMKLQQNDNNNNSSDFQIMGLGLNSNQTLDWNHHPNLLRREEEGEKTESSSRSFRSMVQEQWSRQNSTGNNMFKQNIINRSELITSPETEPNSELTYNSDPMIGYGSPSAILLQGLLATTTTDHQDMMNRPMNNINYAFPTTYDTINTPPPPPPPWHKFPNQYPTTHDQTSSQPFWNPHDAVRPAGFFQSNHPFPPPRITFEEKPEINNNTTLESRELGSTVGKKNNNMNTIETSISNKRARSEATAISPLPAFKVRKEKMGDRITALQQLVSPFGKTDTASVLSEAITYIKFLHEQVGVLSSPYMKNGSGPNNSMQQQQQQQMKSKEVAVDGGGGGAGKQDLRSRGLCLVPVSSTFPVTHEPTVDYWNPTFGGSFR